MKALAVTAALSLSLPLAVLAQPGPEATQASPPVGAVALPHQVAPRDDSPPRASRSFVRRPMPKPVVHKRSSAKPRLIHYSGSAEAWANTAKAIGVANCESGPGPGAPNYRRYIGNPHASGFYSGKWQMDPDFWATYGGLRFASTPAGATEAEQDEVAYRGFLARGWQPWECAHLV